MNNYEFPNALLIIYTRQCCILQNIQSRNFSDQEVIGRKANE